MLVHELTLALALWELGFCLLWAAEGLTEVHTADSSEVLFGTTVQYCTSPACRL